MSKLCLCALLLIQPAASSEVAPEQEDGERRLLSPRRLGTCSDLQKGEFGDITGWHCTGSTGSTQRSLYCNCRHKMKASSTKDVQKGKSMIKIKWDCAKQQEEQCTVGSPSCAFGKCKDASTACGKTWASSLQKTCADLFTVTADQDRCKAILGTEAVCPASVLGSDYKSWANKMTTQTLVDGMLKAAALDTMWYYNKLPSMVESTNETEGMVDETDRSWMPAALGTTAINKHLAVWQKFSCLRNVPQCVTDEPATAGCITACTAVTTSIAAWSAECKTFSDQPALKLKCEGLGYVRDCDGTAPAGNRYPRLCSQFQNKDQQSVTSGAMQTQALSAMVLALVGFLCF